jgi:spermidine/putrescine transport system substrate-binding protein
MNDVAAETIDEVEELLQDMMTNLYALETDSGKADMITGKIIAGYQWTGDAVYAMDQAEEDGVYLKFAIPEECTNLWFDGWVMLKSGINENRSTAAAKKQAAEAFVNFISRPDNVVRNMYYIGYTSVIAGGEDDTIFSYLDWCYGADEEEATISYPVGYFFSGDADDADYVIRTTDDQIDRQLYTQYPSADVITRTSLMGYFDTETSRNINQMWINIRCFSLEDVPVGCWIAAGAFLLLLLLAWLRHRRGQMWREV